MPGVAPIPPLSLSGGNAGPSKVVDTGEQAVRNITSSPFVVNFGKGSIDDSGNPTSSQAAAKDQALRGSVPFAGIGSNEQLLIVSGIAMIGIAFLIKSKN